MAGLDAKDPGYEHHLLEALWLHQSHNVVDRSLLERVLSSRVTMTMLLAGKLAFNTLLAFSQLVLMFLWAWAVFKLDLLDHVPGFVVMGVCTAFSVGAFGMLLASICRTRAQLGDAATPSRAGRARDDGLRIEACDRECDWDVCSVQGDPDAYVS